MKVICVGAMKTGTKTMAKALGVLGYNVYDVRDQFIFVDEWFDLCNHSKIPDFQAIFKDVDATTDLPSSFFFEEILQAFPESKVILMVRDEESWAKSVAETLKETDNLFRGIPFQVASTLSPTFSKAISTGKVAMIALLGSANSQATQIHRKHFHMHNERVKATVPSDQLLVYSVKQGWHPLCEFLHQEIPSAPFPHNNVSAEFIKNQRVFRGSKQSETLTRMKWEMGVRLSILLVAGLSVFAGLFYSRW